MDIESKIIKACNMMPAAFAPAEKNADNLIVAINKWREHVLSGIVELKNNSNKFEDDAKSLRIERDALRAELQQLREQEPVIQIENGIVVNFNPNYDGDVSNGEFYAAPVPATPISKQEPAGAVHELDGVDGDILPPVGSSVVIHLASSDKLVDHTVVGYYAWGPLSGVSDSYSRVFVRVVDGQGILNARLLKDVKWDKNAPLRSIKCLRITEPSAAVAKYSISKEWCENMARLESQVDCDITAGVAQSPRITEQDAREIFNSILENQEFDFDYWINNCEGRALLNKLNANAVASQAAAIPDKKYIIDPRYDDGEYYLLGSDIIALLSASTTPQQ